MSRMLLNDYILPEDIGEITSLLFVWSCIAETKVNIEFLKKYKINKASTFEFYGMDKDLDYYTRLMDALLKRRDELDGEVLNEAH